MCWGDRRPTVRGAFNSPSPCLVIGTDNFRVRRVFWNAVKDSSGREYPR